MSKSSVFKKLAPIVGMVAPFIPGIGIPLAAGLGALGGYASGGNLKSALLGGAGGAIGAGGLGTVAGAPLTGGMQGATQGSGVLGAATRGSGFLSSALRGGANALGQVGNSISSGFGTTAGTPMSGGMSGPTQGSGMMGSVTSGNNFLSNALRGGANAIGSVGGMMPSGAPSGGSMPGGGTANALSTIYSGIQGDSAYKDMARSQQAANDRAMGAVSPYMQTGEAANTRLSSLMGLGGEDEEDILNNLRSSPGYKFRQEQGQDALSKMLSSQGGLQSGRAIKESQRMGQGIADQTYNDYIKNLTAQQSQGRVAAGATMPYQGIGGDIEANKIRSRQQNMDRTLADLMNPGRMY